MNYAWMRVLEVYFYSEEFHKGLSFGCNYKDGKDDVNIKVTGHKYLAGMKDTFTITISNLTYNEILYMLEAKMYRVMIKAGYRNGSVFKIYDGHVIYISNYQVNRETNQVIIICGNRLMAKYGQSKMNFSLSSGINMKSAIEFISRRGGVTNPNIDPTFKNRIINNVTSVESETLGQWLDNFCSANNFVISGDSSSNEDFSLISVYQTTKRLIKLNSEKVVLVNGYPKLTSEGINFTILPTFDLKPLDTIQIDNSILDMSVSSYSQGSEFNIGMFLDTEGKYIIYQLDYDLNNREGGFSITLYGKSRNLYSEVLGVEGYK